MGPVIGDLLPLAVGVAVSPVPVIAVILMLLAPRAGAASAAFGLGWTIGVVAVTVVATAVAGSADLGSGDDPSTAASVTKLVLGILLLLLAGRQWRSRPHGDEPATLPSWMTAIDQVTPVKAAGLGVLLSAVNPKNLLLCVSAGVTVAAAALDTGEQVASVAVFTVVAVSTVVVPAVAYAVAGARMRHPLEELKGWRQANNATVMAVLLLVLGVSVLGKGLGGLL
jgi:threonine/homoserine/homoserine lactone efflux protein